MTRSMRGLDRHFAYNFLSWLSLTGLFVLNDFEITEWMAFSFFVTQALLSLTNRLHAFLALPYILILGPILHKVKLISTSLDEILLVSALIVVTYELLKKVVSTRVIHYSTATLYDLVQIFMFCIVFLSWVLSESLLQGINGMIIALFVLIVHFYIKFILFDQKVGASALRAIIGAAFLSALLIIYAYYANINLNNFLDGNDLKLHFAKGSYFYANIFYILGAAFFVSISGCCSIFYRQLSWVAPLVFLWSLLVYFNKTALLSILIVFLLLLISDSRFKSKVIYFVFVVAFILFINFIANESVDLGKIYNTASLFVRIDIFYEVIMALISDLRTYSVGYGPQFAIKGLKASDLSYIIENQGTIDSGYISYLLEYGFFYVVALCLSLFIIFFKINGYRKLNPSFRYFNAALFFYSLVLITQVLSTGKVFFVMSMFFSLIYYFPAKYHFNGRINRGQRWKY